MKKNSSFLIFLNIVLGVLLVGSILFSFIFGNFGGISLKELKANYINKNGLKFSDLPAKIQENYINKNGLAQTTEVVIKDDRAFDEDGNPIEIIEGSNDNLQSIISSLQSKIVFLEKENMLLNNKKEELLERISGIKDELKSEQHTLTSNNLEKINEVERQHYENISELTMKINDLQRENIRLTQAMTKQQEEKEKQKEVIEKKVAVAKEEIKKGFENTIQKNEAKISFLEQEKTSLKNKFENMRKNYTQANAKDEKRVVKKEKEIQKLQERINNLIKEKNNILTKNNDTMLALEKKNSQKAQEFNKIIISHKSEKDALTQSYKESLEKTQNSYEAKIKSLQSDIDALTQKLLANQEEKKKILLKTKKDFSEEKESLLAKQKNSLQTLLNKNQTLEKALKRSANKNETIKSELEKLKILLQENEDKHLQLKDKIASLEKEKESASENLQGELRKKEEKHNENYRIFNEKIATLESAITTIQKKNKNYIQNLQSQVQEYENKITKELQITKKALEKEQAQKKELAKKIDNYETKIAQLEESNKNLTLSENEKLIEIRESFKDLQNSVDKRESAYEEAIKELRDDLIAKTQELAAYENEQVKLSQYKKEISKLKNTIDTMEGQIVTSDTVPISDKKRKLSQLGKVECDDMNFGNFKISSTCKQKVNDFLDKYDESHYFEVIPIVDTGGFTTLKRIKTDSDLDVPQSEIDRLTNLANLGLGKHRAKEAGWLIRERYEDYAKISYTVYNIEAEDKRGFVIRAYR